MTARTVKLRETDSRFVGKPSAVWLAGHGAFFVADLQNASVFQVDSAGTIARVLGRPGPGPGELEQPLQLVGLGDSALGVADETKKAIEIFALSTGAFQRARPYEGLIMSVAVDGPTVWMGGVSPRHGRGVKRWDLVTDSMIYLVPLPLPYQRNAQLASFFNTVAVAPRGNRLIVGYGADRAVLVVDRDGMAVDSFAVPFARRRGEPADLERRVDPKNDMELADITALTSVLRQLGVRSDGSLVFVHIDFGWVPPRTVTAKAFVSVVSADLTRACVDAPLPQEDPSIAPIEFRGDTLFTVQQHVGGGQRAETSLVGYLIDSSRCDWVPVGHGRLH